MEVSYHREMKKNYLMIEADEEGMQAFEAKMLVGNAIEGLLKFRIRRTDDHCQFCYEITSRQPLGRLLETKSINAVQLRALLLGIAQTLIRMEDYLLSEHQILLDPDYIYIDPESFQPGLCLLPGKNGSFPDEFSEFLQFLLGKADHQDKDAVVLIYGLYRESLKENYGLDNLLRWLMRDEGKAGEEPEKLLEEKEEYRSRSSSGRNGYPGKWDSQPEILDGEKEMSPGPEKRPEAEAESGTGEAVIQENAWSLKTIVLRIVECLLLIPVFLAAIWLWKGSDTLPYLTGDGIWLTVGAVAAEGIGCVLVIGSGIATQRKNQESENHRHRKRDKTRSQMEKQYEKQQGRQGGKQGERQQQRQWEKQQERRREKPSWEMIFAEDDGEREMSEDATGHYIESAYKSDANEKSEPDEKSEPGRSQNESDDCHTVLLWDRNKKENVRRMACLDHPELTAQMSYYPFLIGKQESLADFTIPDDTVSRLHVRIDQKDGGYTLTDLNSTNGTTVNNRKLEANEMVPLQVGDLVDIAGYHFQFL